MSQHTPEPWSYANGDGHYEGAVVIIGGRMTPRSPLAHIRDICGDAEADARRIVACVNACRGIRTSTLENSSTAKEPGISSSYEQIISERDFAISQRDELLAALIACRDHAGCQDTALKIAEAAIAKCEDARKSLKDAVHQHQFIADKSSK